MKDWWAATKAFFGAKDESLLPFESDVLAALISSFDDDTAANLESQIEAITSVERQAKGKFVLLSYGRAGDDLPRLARRDIEFLVGYVWFQISGPTLRADIWSEDGLIMALKFSQEPNPTASDQTAISEVNNLLPADGEPSDSGEPTLRELASDNHVSEVVRPAPPARREGFVGRWGAPFPEDYVALLEETDGFTIGDKVFEGTRQRTITWPDQNLQFLFENESQTLALCIVEPFDVPQVFLLNQLEHSLTPLGSSFVDAARSFLDMAAP